MSTTARRRSSTEARKELGMTLSRCGAFNEAIQELSAVARHL